MSQQHTCVVCGKTGPWTRTWSWYGSFLQSENCPDTLDKVCSAACRAKHKPSKSCLAGHKRALAAARAIRYPGRDNEPPWG